MKFKDLKIKTKVIDTWFPQWGRGVVKKKLKTVVKIKFRDELKTYDRSHCQFLREIR